MGADQDMTEEAFLTWLPNAISIERIQNELITFNGFRTVFVYFNARARYYEQIFRDGIVFNRLSARLMSHPDTIILEMLELPNKETPELPVAPDITLSRACYMMPLPYLKAPIDPSWVEEAFPACGCRRPTATIMLELNKMFSRRVLSQILDIKPNCPKLDPFR